MIPTYQDCVNHLLDYLGSDPSDAALRDAKKSVNEAYRDLANAHTWTYLYTPSIIQTAQMIAQIQTIVGSAMALLLRTSMMVVSFQGWLLLHAQWPSWAHDGMLVLGHNDPTDYGISYGANLAYLVDRVISPTVLTLREESNPGEDIPYPAAYAFYRDSYPLPRDFIAQDVTFIPNNFPNLQFIHPREWMRISQNEVRVGKPLYYSILGYDREPGRHAVHFSPIPDIKYEIHYAYKRLPRAVRLYEQSAGVVSVDADLVTVIGLKGANFTKAMEGNSIIRFSAQGSTELPTDQYRDAPYDHEALVTNYLDQTHVLIEPEAPAAYQGVRYVISDVMDIDPGSMTTVLLRLCEQKLSVIRILKDRQFPKEEFQIALDRAKCADSRTMMGRSPREYLFNRSADISLWRNR